MRPLLLLVGLGICGRPVAAQIPNSASHMQTAEDILELNGLAPVLDQSRDRFVAEFLAMNPGAEPFRDIVDEWTRDVYDWKRLKPLIAAQLVELFTESELRDVLDFLRTPTGQKWSQARPALQQHLVTVLDAARAEGLPHLGARLEARAAQLRRPAPVLN